MVPPGGHVPPVSSKTIKPSWHCLTRKQTAGALRHFGRHRGGLVESTWHPLCSEATLPLPLSASDGSGRVSLGTATSAVSRLEAEDKSEDSRTGGKHGLVLFPLPGYVPSAQCLTPTLASVSFWVPVGLIT